MVLCVAWYAAALYLGGDEFFDLQFVKENFARYFVHGEGGTGHQKPFYYFVPYLFTLGMPWTLFLPGMIWSYFSDRFRLREDLLFLGLWAATVFVFFSLSAGKRPPYILPLYPPLALLIAVWLRDQTVAGFWKTSYFKFVAVFASLTGVCSWRGFGDLLDSVGCCCGAPIARGSDAREASPSKSQIVLSALRDVGWLVPVSFVAAHRVLVFNCAESLPMPH